MRTRTIAAISAAAAALTFALTTAIAGPGAPPDVATCPTPAATSEVAPASADITVSVSVLVTGCQ